MNDGGEGGDRRSFRYNFRVITRLETLATQATKELDNRVKLLNLDCKVIALLPLTR